MKRQRTRRGRVGLAAALAVSIATGVGAAGVSAKTLENAGPATAEAATRTTTVTLSGWASSPAETAALRAVIAAFERQNRTIKVQYSPISGDYDAAMLSRFAAKRPPDVFYVESLDFHDYLPALEPLGSYIKRTGFATTPFYARLLNAFRSKGQIYGFPKDWSSLGLIVNTRMTRAAGITRAPTTWAQLEANLQRLQSRNAVPGGAPACLSLDWARILAFMIQNKGHFITNGRATVNTAANRQTLNKYLGWLRSGLAKTPGQLGVGWCGEALGKEKAAIVIEGNWIIGYMGTDFPSVNFAVWPMVRNKQAGNLGFTVAYAIGKASKKKEQAWRLLRFLVGRQGMGIWTRGGIALPSRRDVKVPAGRANLAKAAPVSRPWQFGAGFQKVIDAAGNELTATFEGKQSVDAMLRKIHALVADQLRKGRR
jgi:multiple sugar transport system substrate-binding protein